LCRRTVHSAVSKIGRSQNEVRGVQILNGIKTRVNPWVHLMDSGQLLDSEWCNWNNFQLDPNPSFQSSIGFNRNSSGSLPNANPSWNTRETVQRCIQRDYRKWRINETFDLPHCWLKFRYFNDCQDLDIQIESEIGNFKQIKSSSERVRTKMVRRTRDLSFMRFSSQI
jgi:hypothetical protein